MEKCRFQASILMEKCIKELLFVGKSVTNSNYSLEKVLNHLNIISSILAIFTYNTSLNR